MTEYTNNPSPKLRLVLALLLTGATSAALAASYPERLASEERSAAVGLGAERLPLLIRETGPGTASVADALLKRFHSRSASIFTSDRFQREEGKHQTTLVSDDGWYLRVVSDGTGVRYRDYGYLDRVEQLARPLKERFGQAELAKMGRAFIAEYLADLVPLGKNEELLPYFTEFELSGGGGTERGAPAAEEMLHTSTVVFGRTIDGLPVVGAGSKIAVIFANDGEPIGFDYDWPSYRATDKMQSILSLDQIKRRGQEYGAFAFKDPEVRELHFECGYVDFGARKRDPEASVQAGCMRQAAKTSVIDEAVHAKDPNSGHIVSASLDFLPAGEVVEPDAVWLKARKLHTDPGAAASR